jgi:hypothetical protein
MSGARPLCVPSTLLLSAFVSAPISAGVLPPLFAAKRVIAARYDHALARSDGLQTLEQVPFLRWVWFVIGVLPQIIKLMACSGLPWTQAWGSFYLASFAVVELMGALTQFAPEEDEFTQNRPSDRLLDICGKSLGTVAVLLQLAVLAWVDLAVIPLDPDLMQRWGFRMLRLCGHLVVLLIHVPLIVLMSESPRLSPDLRRAATVLSMLLICVLLSGFHNLNLRYTQMYFMWSIIFSASAWLLFFLPVTRRHVLLCDSRTSGYWNILSFDFFAGSFGSRSFGICGLMTRPERPSRNGLNFWARCDINLLRLEISTMQKRNKGVKSEGMPSTAKYKHSNKIFMDVNDLPRQHVLKSCSVLTSVQY